MSRLFSLVVSAGGLLMLTFSSPAHAQQQGIKVHGHWVIEVRNSDGSMAQRREFENALVSDGAGILAGLFERAITTIVGWRVVTEGAADPCQISGSTICIIGEADDPIGASIQSTNLTVTRSGPAVILQGSVVAKRDGEIGKVNTRVSVRYSAGPTTGYIPFTSATLETPVAVQNTQTVSITVTFSFS